MNGLTLAIGCGVLLLGGVWLIVGAFLPAHPRLSDALGQLDGTRRLVAPSSADGIDRLGAWVRFRAGGGVDDLVARQLQLRRISVNRFYTHKALAALVGLVLPSLLSLALLVGTGTGLLIPAVAGLVGAVVGFFVPDLLLRRGAVSTTSDATESLLTFVDLVTLERLANQSATQALRAAAGVSEASVFVAVREALERARLEQRAPFVELKRLGTQLNLPALCDIADVMRLDESGAALSGALRARVKELRDAHLTAAKITASNVSERMTLFMVIPSLIFGLIFLVPPLLKLIGEG